MMGSQRVVRVRASALRYLISELFGVQVPLSEAVELASSSERLAAIARAFATRLKIRRGGIAAADNVFQVDLAIQEVLAASRRGDLGALRFEPDEWVRAAVKRHEEVLQQGKTDNATAGEMKSLQRQLADEGAAFRSFQRRVDELRGRERRRLRSLLGDTSELVEALAGLDRLILSYLKEATRLLA